MSKGDIFFISTIVFNIVMLTVNKFNDNISGLLFWGFGLIFMTILRVAIDIQKEIRDK